MNWAQIIIIIIKIIIIIIIWNYKSCKRYRNLKKHHFVSIS